MGNDRGEQPESGRGQHATTVGQAFGPRTLPPRARTALAEAITQLVDDAFEDWLLIASESRRLRRAADADVAPGAPAGTGWAALAEQSHLAALLPERYAARYSPMILKQFALCLFTVAWKLAQPTWIRPACVAEELALRAIVAEARALLELDGQQPFDFGEFEDEAFDDLDAEYLFAPALDGIDGTAVGEHLGITPLGFADWFRAFGGGEPPYSAVHPYGEDDPATAY